MRPHLIVFDDPGALTYGDRQSVVIRGYSLSELVGNVSFAEA
jgi:hypothetical protein